MELKKSKNEIGTIKGYNLWWPLYEELQGNRMKYYTPIKIE